LIGNDKESDESESKQADRFHGLNGFWGFV